MHKSKKSETTKLLELKSFSGAMFLREMDYSDHLNSLFEFSEIHKALVLHSLSGDRRQVLRFVRPLKRVGNFQE